jgi:ATP synthase I subunit
MRADLYDQDFYDQALRRIRILTAIVGVAGTVIVLVLQNLRSAAGFLLGAALSTLNFYGISNLAKVLGGTSKPGPFAALLIALRYLVIACAVYVIIRFLGFGPVAVLSGLLAAFGAVILEILYELVFRIR